MGSEVAIATYKTKLINDIEVLKNNYCETNALRNPFKDLELYILPAIIAFISFMIAKIIDVTCNNVVCEATELAFRRIYGIILFIIIALAWK